MNIYLELIWKCFCILKYSICLLWYFQIPIKLPNVVIIITPHLPSEVSNGSWFFCSTMWSCWSTSDLGYSCFLHPPFLDELLQLRLYQVFILCLLQSLLLPSCIVLWNLLCVFLCQIPGHTAHKYCGFLAIKRPLRVVKWLTSREFKITSLFQSRTQKQLYLWVNQFRDLSTPVIDQMLFNNCVVAMMLEWLMSCPVDVCSCTDFLEDVKGFVS